MKHSLFTVQSIDTDLLSVINFSLLDSQDFMQSPQNIDFWVQTELKRNIENKMQSWGQQLITSGQIGNNCCSGGPPGSGFKVTFGLQILLSYKIRFKANLNAGYGQRYGDFGATTSFHISAYNSGLGVGVNKNNLVVDITAAANVIIGGGHGTPLQSYSLNNNSPIPMLNDFKNSFSYGQLYTWNSALHENQFSLSDLQREGMIGFRIGEVNVSTANDTKRAYFGGGTDMGHTGQLSIVTPFLEVGFQDFTGDYRHDAKNEKGRDLIVKRIKEIENNQIFSKEEKKQKISILESEKKILTYSNYHNQTSYQKNLNKASTYLRFSHQNGYNATIDLIGDAWLQNAIHRTIKDFRFEYEHKNIQGWFGKSF